jgi:hypothetical protein
MLTKRHEKLAREIEQLKSKHDLNRLMPAFELQGKLRQAIEISASLTLLNRELESLEKTRQEHLGQLLTAYDRIILAIVIQIRSDPEKKRKDYVLNLSAYRQKRQRVRTGIHLFRTSMTLQDHTHLLNSNDPDELKERADAIRDEQDHIKAELRKLDGHLADLEADKRLDQEMNDFIGDQDIFDEESLSLHSRPNSNSISEPGKSFDAADPMPPIDISDSGEPLSVNGPEPSERFHSPPDNSGLEPPETLFIPSPIELPAEQANDPSSIHLVGINLHRRKLLERIKHLQSLDDQLRARIDSLEHQDPIKD